MRPHAKAASSESKQRRTVLGLSTLGLTILVAAIFVAVASGGQTHLYTGTSFGPDGTSGTTFKRAGALASDSSGNLYLAEITEGKIEKFSPTGTPIDFSATPGSNEIPGIAFRFSASESQLAVAADGSIYATSSNSVLAFSASGEPLNFTAGPNAGTNEIPGFSELLGVAVDGNGAIYAADYGGEYGSSGTADGGIAVYAPTGELLTSLHSERAGNVAVDSAGNVYVARYNGHVTRFAPSSFPVTATTTYTETGEVDPGTATSVAVNPATDNVYVDRGDHIREYEPDGTALGRSPVDPDLLSSSQGVTAAGTGVGERLYVSDTQGSRQVRIFGPAVLAPDVATGDSTELTNTTAKLTGTVNPAGVETTYQFEYGTTTDYGAVAPVPPALVGSDSTDHPVEVELTDLEPNTVYHYRLNGMNPSVTIHGEDRTFRTTGPASVETTGSPIRTATTALLEGRVNPQENSAGYFFEYGSEGPCASSGCVKTQAAQLAQGDEIIFVAERVSGLEPGTTYHYRLVADNGNSAGAATGADMTVTTLASDAPLPPGQHPGPPGSDRGWELVSAPDTGGHSVNEAKAISDDGERVVYNVKGGTPESTLGSLSTPLISERTDSGWQSTSFTPPQVPGTGRELGWFSVEASDDLSVLVGQQAKPNAVGLWALRPGGSKDLLSEYGEGRGVTFVTAADGSRVVARPAPANFGEPGILYDVTSGTPEEIGILPNGLAPACGVDLPDVPKAEARWVSDDGSLAFFSSPGDDCSGPHQLYVRDIDAEATARISPPPLSGPTCTAALIRSTADAAYFWTSSRIAPDDIAVSDCARFGDPGGDVYRYHLGSQAIECLTCVSSPQRMDVATPLREPIPGSQIPISAFGNIAVSEDGSRLYFSSFRQLVPGAAASGIYRLRTQSGDLRYIGPASGNGGIVGQVPAFRQGLSADGSTIFFASEDPRFNPIGGQNNGSSTQYYLYDDDNLSLTCASCPRDGQPPIAPVQVSERGGIFGADGPLTTESATALGPNLSLLSSDGSVLGLTVPSPLVREDQNTPSSAEDPVGGSDVYELRDGIPHLVSDGSTNWAETVAAPHLAGVSQSGTDVYFTAAAQLTPDALDDAPRLYDARIGGGFEFARPAPPCPLEVCQGSPPQPPVQATPGSTYFQGPPNPKQGTKKCPKGKHKVKVRGKKRCVKQRSDRNKQGKNANQRGAK